MTRFHGIHSHALTNAVFDYDGELLEQGPDLVNWRAVVRQGGKVVDTFSGTTAYDPALSDATRAATTEIHTLIDARDHEQAPLA